MKEYYFLGHGYQEILEQSLEYVMGSKRYPY